jgi:eukaryotic-like serine/threonine-protein kinase
VPTLGPYEILDRVGAGGLGEVLRARDLRHGRTVAIKCLPEALASDPARIAAFTATAGRLAGVSHPHVAALYETGVGDGRSYVALEYVPGRTLTQVMAGRPLHPRRAVEIALEAARGLAALHDAGIAHGDVKPDNIMITPKGHAKLLDAGLSEFTAGGRERRALTTDAHAGSRLAFRSTLAFASPEELLGERPDHRADLFALGAVLYEMLVGRAPFDADSREALVLQVLHVKPPSPGSGNRAIPARLDSIVERLLSKSLDSRYQSAAEATDDLAAVQRTFASDAGKQDASIAPVPRAGRGRRLTLLLALGGLAGVAWWYFVGP